MTNTNFNSNLNATVTLTVIGAIAAILLLGGTALTYLFDRNIEAILCFATSIPFLFAELFLIVDKTTSPDDRVMMQMLMLAGSVALPCLLIIIFMPEYWLAALVLALIVLVIILFSSHPPQSEQNRKYQSMSPFERAVREDMRKNTFYGKYPNNKKKRPPQEKIW